MRGPALLALLLAACGGAGAGAPDAAPTADAGPPPRALTVTAGLGAGGVSAPVIFTVPDGTRSLTVIAAGAPEALFALATLTTADGVEHTGLDPAGGYGAEMRASYQDEQIGQMPGALYQSVRLGTFTHVFPYRPDQALPAGPTELRVASDAAGGDVTVTLLMPADDGAGVLHLDVIGVADAFRARATRCATARRPDPRSGSCRSP